MTERAVGIAGFFGELEMRMDGARKSDRHRYRRFFAELNPILDAVGKLERELDRHLAHRFNVFDYMGEDRPSEALLSRIVADLLNPRAPHGQGASMLRTLLDKLPVERGAPISRPDFSKPVRVELERVIPQDRRIDVTVDIETEGGQWCLAIENKPYAYDQCRQVIDYLEYLKKEYDDRFLLIYLSPRGAGPSDYSLPREELPRWRGRFGVMPYWFDPGSAEREAEYAGDDESAPEDDGGTLGDEGEIGGGGNGASADEGYLPDDVYADFRVGFSLADWFAACKARSEADRLRWFLRDAEAFCRQQFGGHSMTTDGATGAIRDYLFSNPNHLRTAQAVGEVWLDVKAELCGGFLEHLRTEVHRRVREELSDITRDLRVECKYGGEKGWSNFLWLYRVGWPPWKNHHKKHLPFEGCTGIVMQSVGPGPNGWRWGVLHPLDKSNLAGPDKERRARLEEKLRRSDLDLGRSDTWWPYVARVSDEKANWDALLPELYREWKDGHGPIMKYYVQGIMNIATKAIPVIEKVESTWGEGALREPGP